MRKRNWVVILLILAGICPAAKAQCPQFELGLQVGTVANDLLNEISGIAASRKNTDVFWVHNDRGGQARVWALNSEGTHLGIYNLSGANNRDWEDIAIGPGPVDGVDYLYVGNIGDGGAPNPYVTVYRVAEPTVDSQQSPVETTLTDVKAINLEYPDGDQYRDAETLMVDPVTKDIYIISKEDVPPRVYRAPYPQSTTTTTTMEHVCDLPSPWDETSGGDISLDGSMIIVRDDDDHASIWLRPEETNLWEAFSGTECSVELPLPSEINGESICFDAEGKGYYTTTEREGGPNPPIYYFAPVYVSLAITEIMSDSNHAGVDGDWWELTNPGTAAVDLTGYSWHDSPTAGIVIFGNIIISAGESIIILNEPSSNTGAWKSVWGLGSEVNVYDHSHFSGSFPGLDSSDNIYIYDSSDVLVTSVHYPGSTSRISNEWDTNGRFGGLSVVGENGAYESTDPRPNVASPGYAVTTGFTGTIYVDSDATGANYGSSWEDAFNYIQDALSLARNGDEIWVAEGIYKPDEDTDNPTGTGDREATFQLKKGVTIKGGYAGAGAPDSNIRDIKKYETILSGDLDGNDVDINDPCDLLAEPTRLENSYHVVTNSNIDETAVLDGFTITAGNANGSPDYERDRGGGMFNNGHDNLCNPTVIECTFICNSAAEFGGGMFNYGHGDGECSPILTNCEFIRNAAGSEGGGMSSWGGHSVVTNCTFGDNYSRYCGGGMANAGSNLTVNNCTFSDNSTNGEGGGMWNYSSNPTLTNCILWGNTDGGPTDESAQIYSYISSTPVINYCCVQGWTGGLGGIGNIGDDPMFVDADGADDVVGTEDDNLRLMEGSPCIDNGDNAAIPVEVETDLDGHPRIIDGDCNDTDIVDMGAYEFNYAYMGDFDYNCEVDFGDFAILALAWLTEPKDTQWNPTCDINIHNDSSINMLDLHVFAENWLAGIK